MRVFTVLYSLRGRRTAEFFKTRFTFSQRTVFSSVLIWTRVRIWGSVYLCAFAFLAGRITWNSWFSSFEFSWRFVRSTWNDSPGLQSGRQLCKPIQMTLYWLLNALFCYFSFLLCCQLKRPKPSSLTWRFSSTNYSVVLLCLCSVFVYDFQFLATPLTILFTSVSTMRNLPMTHCERDIHRPRCSWPLEYPCCNSSCNTCFPDWKNHVILLFVCSS